ncbi:tRNA adenosine(34) deaminase TadA [Pseudorhodoferax sp.]|uniref:tRNA adenosine(34) deaminase TadA n=1 Tax=Pseudorhodoferax sp. TaxID=1993553 RepID=UPI002DD61ADD|nr:tRNA adenosine(34) deaminase TadA [Pseudorhodoferax sp.]
MTDAQAMGLALQEARRAAEQGEVPVGAIVLHRGQVVGTGRNAPITAHDPTAHAEIVALRAAAAALGNYRLDDCELFVTLEPCAMCAGAMLHARLARVVYGAAEPKTGAAGSVLDLFANGALNHHTRLQGGVLGEQCGALMRDFFQQQRQLHARSRVPLREDALRTPAARFDGLADHPWASHGIGSLPSLAGLRLQYLDEGAEAADRGVGALTLLCVHGRHGWSHQYRAMLPVWTQAGHRVVAVDLPGFGQSDKPKREDAHRAEWHRSVLGELVEALDLRDTVLVLQGTGGLLALELPQQAPARYRGLVALDSTLSKAVMLRADGAAWPAGWPAVPPAQALQLLRDEPAPDASDALRAPFPDAGHSAGPRAFARLAQGFFAAPDWPAVQPPAAAAADGGATLAQRVLDAFAVGYSRA